VVLGRIHRVFRQGGMRVETPVDMKKIFNAWHEAVLDIR
jgi:hypothetical protein